MSNSAAPSKGKSAGDLLEETFRRYQPKEETPIFPKIEEDIQRVPIAEKAAEKTTLITEIPPSRLVQTHIPGLDNILGGGITDHSLIMITGETGSNYTTFIQQILYNHTIENGKAAYYNAETLSIDIRQEMEKFNWTLQDFQNKGTWIFTNVRTPELQLLANLAPKILSDGNSIKLTQGLNSLKNDLLNKIKEEYWTALELSHLILNYSLKEIIDLMLYWKTAIRIYGGLHFITLPIGVHEDNQLKALQSIADGVIEFHLREGPHEFETTMTIRKTKHLLKPLILPFTVDESGIIIETASRIA